MTALPMTENELQQRIIELAKFLRIPYWRDNYSRRNIPGWPDIVLIGSTIVYAELKSDIGHLRPEQAAFIDALRNAGAEVHVWRPRDWDEIERRIKRLAFKGIPARNVTAPESEEPA